MINNKKVLGIIPARGGSKRLPKKNILELCNKPLISWSIEAGLNSKYIDKILVTTDDNEIKNISKKYNVEIIDRPLSLAMDTSSTFEALEHAISMIKEKYEYIVLLQPTSPLRKYFHIDEAFELLISKDADAIISVSKMDHSPLWSNTLPKDNCMKDFLRDEIKNKRSQDLESYYQLNGAVFICKTDKLLEEKTFFLKENIFAYIMDKRYSIDIDEEIDFKTAELFLNYYNK